MTSTYCIDHSSSVQRRHVLQAAQQLQRHATLATLVVLACFVPHVTCRHIVSQNQTSDIRHQNQTSQRRPRIYIYKLPAEMTELCWEKHGGSHKCVPHMRISFYGLEFIFTELLAASPYLVADPAQADYFYVPALFYWGLERTMARIIQEMDKLKASATESYWQRKNGSDHIFVGVNDFGGCGIPHEATANSILIHHYGKVHDYGATMCRAMKFDPTVKPQDQPWGIECDDMLSQAFDKAANKTAKRGCHVVGKDIVTPPSPYEHNLHTPYLSPDMVLERNITMFFAGALPELSQEGGWKHEPKTRPNDEPWFQSGYSFGARQTVARMFNDTPGYVITAQHIGNYQEQLASSKFCLAPAGWGWGGRMKVALLHGCVPVIVQDGILTEWEEQLPLNEYALRVPTRFVHRLPEFLEEYESSGRLAHAQAALRCAWRLHMWTRPHGRGFELTLCELKARLLGAKMRLDTGSCRLYCGDDTPVDFEREHAV